MRQFDDYLTIAQEHIPPLFVYDHDCLLEPRTLNRAKIGDFVTIHDVGVYCASFAVHGCNSYPSAKDIFI